MGPERGKGEADTPSDDTGRGAGDRLWEVKEPEEGQRMRMVWGECP